MSSRALRSPYHRGIVCAVGIAGLLAGGAAVAELVAVPARRSSQPAPVSYGREGHPADREARSRALWTVPEVSNLKQHNFSSFAAHQPWQQLLQLY